MRRPRSEDDLSLDKVKCGRPNVLLDASDFSWLMMDVGIPRGKATTTGSCDGLFCVTSTLSLVVLSLKEACFRFLADLVADGAIVAIGEEKGKERGGGGGRDFPANL